MNSTLVQRKDWKPIFDIDRELKDATTEEIFKRFRPLIPRFQGAAKILNYRVAGQILSETGYYSSDNAISTMIFYALVVKWLEGMPEIERMLTVGYFIEQRKFSVVKKYIKGKGGIKLSYMAYWRNLFGPENGRNPRRPSVIDWWMMFAKEHPGAIPEIII